MKKKSIEFIYKAIDCTIGLVTRAHKLFCVKNSFFF
jgi:hypothetical protein